MLLRLAAPIRLFRNLDEANDLVVVVVVVLASIVGTVFVFSAYSELDGLSVVVSVVCPSLPIPLLLPGSSSLTPVTTSITPVGDAFSSL